MDGDSPLADAEERRHEGSLSEMSPPSEVADSRTHDGCQPMLHRWAAGDAYAAAGVLARPLFAVGVVGGVAASGGGRGGG